ncbi:hypothetical protein ACQPXM_02480 [Kribbella sp. CA-253562]|uniref:hypothetical protein n=1 Tax=Kribbella sp. CA-253562 TaxID=3239942 RepID=UPI003D8B7093
MRRLLRWIFWVGPCRFYLAGEASGGAVPFVFLFGLFGFAAALGGVFALIGAVFLADGHLTADQGAFEAPLATADAEILRYDDGPGGFGDRHLVVRFTAGTTEITTKIKAEDRVEESHVPPLGGHQQVEYVITDPTRARPAGATESKKSDAQGSRYFGYACLTLTTLTGAAYLVSRRKRPGGRSQSAPPVARSSKYDGFCLGQ